MISYKFGFAGLCGNMVGFGRNLSNQGVVETPKLDNPFEFIQVRYFNFQYSTFVAVTLRSRRFYRSG